MKPSEKPVVNLPPLPPLEVTYPLEIDKDYEGKPIYSPPPRKRGRSARR